MALNIGIGGAPRKRSGLPPRVGEKPHGMAVIIATPKGPPPPNAGGEPDGGTRPAPPRAGRRPGAPPPAPPLEEEAGGMGGHKILPEAVNYRSEEETCGNCAHMLDSGDCERLEIPVSHGDGCNLFKDRSSGEDADEAAEQYENEGEGEEENELSSAY